MFCYWSEDSRKAQLETTALLSTLERMTATGKMRRREDWRTDMRKMENQRTTEMTVEQSLAGS